MCSDLPVLLQERKRVLVSFFFFLQTITLSVIKVGFMSSSILHTEKQSWSLPQRSSRGESPPALQAR